MKLVKLRFDSKINAGKNFQALIIKLKGKVLVTRKIPWVKKCKDKRGSVRKLSVRRGERTGEGLRARADGGGGRGGYGKILQAGSGASLKDVLDRKREENRNEYLCEIRAKRCRKGAYNKKRMKLY